MTAFFNFLTAIVTGLFKLLFWILFFGFMIMVLKLFVEGGCLISL
tara:strand:+ start:237 stop:371 length:135 start_codon:yes stop_codon:yes gene_type:complete